MGFPHDAVADSAQTPFISLNAKIALQLLDGTISEVNRRNIEYRAKRKLVEDDAYAWKAQNGFKHTKEENDEYKRLIRVGMAKLHEQFPEFKKQGRK